MPAQTSQTLLPPSGTPVYTVTLNPAIDRTLTVPGFTAGEVNRVQTSSDKAGGKGVNVAIALALAGTKVTATGLLGAKNRPIFTETFERLGICDTFTTLDGETRTGLKIVNPSNRQTTDINFPGLSPEPASLQKVKAHLLQCVTAQREECTAEAAAKATVETHSAGSTQSRPPWVALCGSLPPTAAQSLYADWITELKAAGAQVLLDTSGTAFGHGIAAGPSLIKPNQDELQELLGRPLANIRDIAQAARELIQMHGIRLVAVSMGAEGACLVSASAAVHVLPVKIAIHSTVGAGDAMVAGILHALNAHTAAAQTCPVDFYQTTDGLARIAAHGTAFSLATLQQPVATEGTAFRERIAQWLPQIQGEAIQL